MADRFLETARALAADVLAPAAERVDAEGVPVGHIRALRTAGLLGLTAPAALGGGGASAAVGRMVSEVLAGACGATWFVAAQHATPLQTVLASDNREVRARWLSPLARSEALAGVAVSHLRRPGSPVTATATAEGWRFDGRVDWMTSWGLADVVLLSGLTAAADVVLALLSARDQPGLRATAELRLAAMEGAHNVGLTVTDLRVPAAAVASVAPLAEWQERDRQATANARPAVFGLLRTITDRLAAVAAARGSNAGAELAAALAEEGAALRQQAYALLDDVPADERLDDRLAIRADALEVLNRAASALVVTGAGTAMLRSNPAQRLAREAMFHLVQAQTPAVREATLRRLHSRTHPG